jgi:hypothetical protein
MQDNDPDDASLWQAFCAAEDQFYVTRMALAREVKDLHKVLASALKRPGQRGTALRLLDIRPVAEIREHFATLVELASVGHSDIGLVRRVLLKLDAAWIVANIEAHAAPLLAAGDDEEYRRIAELYSDLDRALLDRHLDRCAVHDNPHVREIAADFRDPD